MGYPDSSARVRDAAVRRDDVADEPAGPGRLIGGLVLFFLVGTPMIAYVWHVLSDALAGRVALVPIVAALVLLALFLVLLRRLIRFIERAARGPS